MTSEKTSTVQIYLLGKEYQIACAEDQLTDLKLAAKHLDQQMRKVRDSGKVIGLERIAIMTALNLSHDLLNGQGDELQAMKSNEARLANLNDKLDAILGRYKPGESCEASGSSGNT